MDIVTALALIREEATPHQAQALLRGIHDRQRLLAQQDDALISSLVTVGAPVKVRDNFVEKHLRGLTGVVRSENGTTTTVLLDEQSTVKYAAAAWVPNGHVRYLLHRVPLRALRALDVPEGFAELAAFVFSQTTLEDLAKLHDVGKRRFLTLAADLVKGDTVMVTNVSPRFLVGLTGTVEQVDKETNSCEVQLDEASTDRLRLQGSPEFFIPAATPRHRLRLRFGQALVTERQ